MLVSAVEILTLSTFEAQIHVFTHLLQSHGDDDDDDDGKFCFLLSQDVLSIFRGENKFGSGDQYSSVYLKNQFELYD